LKKRTSLKRQKEEPAASAQLGHKLGIFVYFINILKYGFYI
jgi:hypothetical protein